MAFTASSVILADTSIWIDYINEKKHSSWNEVFDYWIKQGKVGTCGVVMAEFFPFIDEKRLRDEAEGLLTGIPYFSHENDPYLWKNVIDHSKSLRAHGVNGMGIADMIIVSIVQTHQLTLFSSDHFFTLARSILPFDLITPQDL